MSIDVITAVQEVLGLEKTHLVHITREGFDLAHTELEREFVIELADASLENCKFHRFFSSHDEAPLPDGIYTVEWHESEGWVYDRIDPEILEDVMP